MPKLLILYSAPSADVAPLADVVADGARSVRFAEVDVRRIGEADGATKHRTLERLEDVAPYDGIILGVGARPDTAALAERIGTFGGALTDKVGSAFTTLRGDGRVAALWTALTPMADRGMILVPSPFAEGAASEEDIARRLGKRVAEVIGWVTHARSHHHHDHGSGDHHHH